MMKSRTENSPGPWNSLRNLILVQLLERAIRFLVHKVKGTLGDMVRDHSFELRMLWLLA